MEILGLTGGIASGKSTVSELFIDWGIPVVDADQVARQVVEPGTRGLKQLVRHFGKGILHRNGQLNRQKLGRLVFASKQQLKRLNQVMRPLIREASEAQFQAYADQKVPLIVFDAPTLFEAGYEHDVDEIMVVSVSADVQLHRLMVRNQLTEVEARQRINSQIPLQEKVAQADVVIDNDGPVEATRQQVVKWLEQKGISPEKK